MPNIDLRAGLRVLAVLPLLVLAACDQASVQVLPQTLRVMSYNIRFASASDGPSWDVRREPLARQVAFTDPDVIGLQEAEPAQVAYLAERWPDYDHYGLGRDDGVHGEATTVFWRRDRFEKVATSTQWCSPTRNRPGKGWDAPLPRTVTRVALRDRASGRLYDVRNTHLDNEGAVSRENCAREIVAMAPVTDAAVIVIGDMNSGPESPPYRILTGDALGLKDARKGAAVDFGPPRTFNGFDLAAVTGGDIDHIFVPRDFPVARYGVLTDSSDGRAISDHFPIVADLTVEP